ncbi:threonine synthase [Ardenticatena maritima]|uniref:Threonine synthase n=1 Tax=Ardenticatena maritima TaxID=872965 RepID=A0A0M8K9X9_9CHLR|nr:threonine synthase [Ardenticatena maritima]KPL89346.1 threonine synthase [Ardenticatena maritima]GAP63742.1 threonine synthase [Ardenticatena maritima]
MQRTSFLSHLECGWCGATYDADRLWNLCPACERPLLARYDLEAARQAFPREALRGREPTLWRYTEMLPVRDPAYRLTLGEGFTPLLPFKRLGARLGLTHLYAKDEGLNPTASFKARGLCMAVSRAAELGVSRLAIPTAGNAGSALAAYAARAGIPAHVFAPADVPPVFVAEMRALGAEVTLVEGLITDAARFVREGVAAGRWFDVSTLKEPYRVEGKKTMGYELAEQFGWRLPDVIVYPTGGGTGLVGMWKAFAEMEALGWIDDKRPRMVSVQSAGCAPIVRAFQQGADTAEPWENAATIADGLRVPAAVGDFLILRAIRESGGTAVAVSDDEIRAAQREIGAQEGVFVAPEAAATWAAVQHLVRDAWIAPDERVVLFLTGSGLKYTHLVQDA